MRKRKTKLACLLGIGSLSVLLPLNFIQNNNQQIFKVFNNNNNSEYENFEGYGLIDKPFVILNYASDQGNSIDIYLYGDGYRKDSRELESLYRSAKNSVATFFDSPQYRMLKNYINVYLIFTDSQVDGNYNINNSENKTFFETYATGRTFAMRSSGKEKARILDYQAKNRITKRNGDFLTRSNVFIDTSVHGGVSFGKSLSLSAGSSIGYTGTFLHEMSHNFSLDDEYQEGKNFAQPTDPNRTSIIDPNKVQWREFLGYRNIGIYHHEFTTKDFLIPYVSDPNDVSYTCRMRTNSSDFLCEVCRWESFNFINQNFENKMDYVSFPSITASYNSGDYQKNRKELVNEDSKHNIEEIKNNLNKKIDLRTMFFNSKNKPQKIKLKLTIRDKSSNNDLITEQVFLVQSNEIKQLKLTSKDSLVFSNASNIELIGEVIDVETSNVLATNQNFWKEPKKLIVNFIDNSTNNKIDFINKQTYEYYDDKFVKNFVPQNLVGYKFKSKDQTSDGNNIVLNLHYDPLKYKEIKMNLYDSLDLTIKETKKWKVFENETFKPSEYDFIISNNKITPLSSTVSYDQLDENPENNNLNYLIEYNSLSFEVNEENKTINVGDDTFDVYSNAVIKTEKDKNYIKNKYYSNQIIIEDGNFNPYIPRTYTITYKYKIWTSIMTKTTNIIVQNSSSTNPNEKELINQIAKITNKRIVVNAKGKNKEISEITKSNIEQYVDNWPKYTTNNISISLEKFEPNINNDWINLTFKFTKNSISKKYVIQVSGFKSIRKEVNDTAKWVETDILPNIGINQKGQSTNIQDVNSSNIKDFVTTWPVKSGFYFEPIIDKDNKQKKLILSFNVWKDNFFKKVEGRIYVGDFLVNSNNTITNPEYPDKFGILHKEVEKINSANLVANSSGSKINVSDVRLDNLQSNINNFPKINSDIHVSIDFLAISNQENGGNILVRYSLSDLEGNSLYSNFKEITGFEPNNDLLLTRSEIVVRNEIKRLTENPPKINELGRKTHLKDVKWYEIGKYLDNKPKNIQDVIGYNTQIVNKDDANGVIQFSWSIISRIPNENTIIKETPVFTVEGFLKDENGTNPPVDSDNYKVELKEQSTIYLENIINNSVKQNYIVVDLYKNNTLINNQSQNYFYEWKINNQLQNINTNSLPINFKKFGNYTISVEVYQTSKKEKLLASNNKNITLNKNNIDPTVSNNFDSIKNQMQQKLISNIFKISDLKQIDDQWVNDKIQLLFSSVAISQKDKYTIVFDSKAINSVNKFVTTNVYVKTSIYSEELVKSSLFSLKLNYTIDSNSDIKDVENAIKEFNNKKPQINQKGKQTNIKEINQSNIQQYVDNWPSNKNGVVWTIESFKKDEKSGSIEINFKAQKGKEQGNAYVKISGFIPNNNDGEINPPVTPPTNKPNKPSSNNSNSSSKLPIILAVVFSLLGIGLIAIPTIFIVIKKRKK